MKKDSYSFCGRCPLVLASLDQFCEDDKRAEKVKNDSGAVAGIFAFLGIIAICFVGIWSWMWFGVLASVLCAIGALGVYIYASGHDLDEARVGVARGLVQILQTDVPEKSKLRLKIDLRSYLRPEFLKSQYEQVKVYAQPWLQVQAKLADGSSVAITVVRHARRKTKMVKKSRQNGGVELKLKVKERLAESVTVGLKAAPGRHPDLQGLAQHLDEPPLELQLQSVRAQGNELTTRVMTAQNHYLSADAVLAVLVWIFRGLKRLTADTIAARPAGRAAASPATLSRTPDPDHLPAGGNAT